MDPLKRNLALSRPPGRRSLAEDVAGDIREKILLGDLRPGDVVRLDAITSEQRVSATPVREALLILARDGFVTQGPRRNFLVSPFSRQDVRDLFWAQSRLAGELAARGTARIAPDELARLDATMRQCDEAVELDDAETTALLGNRFHRIINRAARSPRLTQMLAAMVTQLPNHFYASVEANVLTAPRQHHEIFAAVTARDVERARILSEDHIIANAHHVIDMLEARGVWEDEEAPRA